MTGRALAAAGSIDRLAAPPPTRPDDLARASGTNRASGERHDTTEPRPNWFVALPLIALNVLLTWLGRAPGITTRQDDAVYLMLARALRAGSGYVELFTPGHPPHTQYPPVYPAVLAALTSVVGERIDLLLLVNALCTGGALALFYSMAARRWRPRIAVTALALAAINPAISYFSGNLLSEPLFTLLLFATFAVALRERQSWKSLLVVGILAVVAAFTRTAGLSLLLAVGATWLLERRWVAAASLAVAGGGVAAAWLIRAAHAPNLVPGRSYVADALAGAPRSRLGFLATLAARAASNGKSYLTETIPWVLPAPTIRGTSIDNVLCILVLLVCGAFGLAELWRRARVVAVFLGCYGLLLLAWTWPVDRFLMPTLPLLLLTLVAGAVAATRRYSGWRAIGLLAFVGVAIAGEATRRDVVFLATASHCDRAQSTTAATCYNADQRAFFEAAREVARVTPASAIVASQKPATFYYYSSGREVVPLEVAMQTRPAGFYPFLTSQAVSAIVLEHTLEASTRVATRLASACDRLRVARAVTPVTIVFQLEPRVSPVDSSAACAAVATYQANQSHWPEQIW